MKTLEEKMKARLSTIRKIRKALEGMEPIDQAATLEELASEIKRQPPPEAPRSRSMGDGVGDAPESSELGA